LKKLNYMPMKKILLASGCSFTTPNFISELHPKLDCSWPKWPELLAKKLDMDCINLGQNGAGNEYIYSSLLEKILEIKDKSQIGLVIPAWTQSQRIDYQVNSKGIWKNERYNPNGDVFSFVKKSLRYMLSLQILCERYNIPYKQCQMISLFDGWINGLWKTDIERYSNRNDPNFKLGYAYPGNDPEKDRKRCQQIMLEYETYINVKNFIGWPLVTELGGHTVEVPTLRHNAKSADDDKEWITDYLISNIDLHPNEKGHKVIAEFLYDRLG